jgi:hypothetical protein
LLTLVRVCVEDRPRVDEVDRRKDDVEAAAIRTAATNRLRRQTDSGTACVER